MLLLLSAEGRHLVVDGRAHEPVRRHVCLDLRQRLESVQECSQLGVLGHDVGGQHAVLVQQLVHDEVHEGDVDAGEPGVLAQEGAELVQFGGQRGQVLALQLFLHKKTRSGLGLMTRGEGIERAYERRIIAEPDDSVPEVH